MTISLFWLIVLHIAPLKRCVTAHTNTDATAVSSHMHAHTHTHSHLTLVNNTHTQMHWDVLIGRAGVSWEYESGSMTSLLFTGIRSSLSSPSTPPPLPVSPPTLSPSLSNHIDAVTRLVMSKAHLTAFLPVRWWSHTRHRELWTSCFTFFLASTFSFFFFLTEGIGGQGSFRCSRHCKQWKVAVLNLPKGLSHTIRITLYWLGHV